MKNNWLDEITLLIHAKRYSEAIDSLKFEIIDDKDNWNAWYLLGQCYRYLDDYPVAISCLQHSFELNKKSPPVLLALGIAYQLNNDYDLAISAFHSAINLDRDYVMAYNSLALTYKRMGDFNKSLEIYNNSLEALARTTVKEFKNNKVNPIIKHQNTSTNLWVKHAMSAAVYLGARLDFNKVLFPTSKMAEEEENTEKHKGLYWVEITDKDAKSISFLPNYFNTFRECLRANPIYGMVQGNISLVLLEQGKEEEAISHQHEASYFS